MSKTEKRIFIREAESKDVSLVLQFIRDLAHYEKEPDAVVASEAMLETHLFGKHPKAFCLIAFYGQEAAGFALYFYNFSTWLGRPGLYLEDLFVRPQMRKHGVGSALLRKLARIALDHDCGRLEWAALNWNKLATDFYEKIGAEPLSEWTTYRIEGEEIERLAREES